MPLFKLHAPYAPTGDQPKAIAALSQGLRDGLQDQVLLGVTGSGKTYTMACIIAEMDRPALIIAHNKTLAAQLCSEFREFFPENAVEYFVSYYDYYQPEAYIPASDTYIEKDSAINDEIDKLRHSATSSLMERRDVIVVASVSCIYGLGDPHEYLDMSLSLRPGMEITREALLARLVEMQYDRNDINFIRSTFRVRGDTVEIFPASEDSKALRVEMFGDEIDRILEFDALTGKVLHGLQHVIVFPASHYATSPEKMQQALEEIRRDMELRVSELEGAGKLLEAQRLRQRTQYDLEMMDEIGYCSGIENYSRYFDGRSPGDPAFTLLDFLPDDYLLFIDESHVTVSQIRAMYAGDRSRKDTLVQYGFRLPSAYDNRPLTFDEFLPRMGQTVYVSATPAEFEMNRAGQVAEQIIRPTGLVDPEITVRPIEGQMEDLLNEIRNVTARKERVLITTLTKKMAEALTDYLADLDVRVRYLHSDIETMERVEILRDLRMGKFDVLVGINLLREGLDLPEVSLVAILDADKEGFLRSERSLIQTIGRAARNVSGRVIMYADIITDSMRAAIDETNRRRALQMAYNAENHITPRSIESRIRNALEITVDVPEAEAAPEEKPQEKKSSRASRRRLIVPDKPKVPVFAGAAEEKPAPAPAEAEAGMTEAELEKAMLDAAQKLDFERAAELRDRILAIRAQKAEQKG